MALADPQSIKFGSATAISLPRTSSGVNTGEFTAADGTARLSVVHQYGKRQRRSVRTEQNKIAPDPLLAANTKYSLSVRTVLDHPPVGFTLAELKEAVDAHCVLLQAQILKIAGGES